MRVLNLLLTNYRNHKKFKIEFDPKITLITGKNGVGKTNVLEAIHMLSTGKSFRAEYDRDLISHNHAFARIDAEIDLNHNQGDQGETDKAKLELLLTKSEKFDNASSKKVKLNKVAKTINTFTDLTKTVLFTPEDIDLVIGSPGQRRRYIDSVLVQTGMEYKRALSTYTKALRQRNKILELIAEENKGHALIDFWTDKILETGQVIQTKREDYFFYLKRTLPLHAQNISGNGKNNTVEVFDITYKKNEISRKRLEDYKEKELYAKTTLVGPHRDDFEILLNGYDIANFGSRGQQRTSILGLKLGEIDYFNSKLEIQPILLLDDIFSELDKNHREAVMEVLNNQQTIITSTEHFDLPFKFVEVKL